MRRLDEDRGLVGGGRRISDGDCVALPSLTERMLAVEEVAADAVPKSSSALLSPRTGEAVAFPSREAN